MVEKYIKTILDVASDGGVDHREKYLEHSRTVIHSNAWNSIHATSQMTAMQ
jgi:hypothetical protein